jgi:hypothetical protein
MFILFSFSPNLKYRKGEAAMHENHIELLKDKKLTNTFTIEGVGTIEEYGELDLEKLVKRLLKSAAITG